MGSTLKEQQQGLKSMAPGFIHVADCSNATTNIFILLLSLLKIQVFLWIKLCRFKTLTVEILTDILPLQEPTQSTDGESTLRLRAHVGPSEPST